MSALKPIKVYGQGGPNPPKVAILLAELALPHEITPVPFSDVKSPSYLAVNPNGRLPALHDPNANLTLWESNAIIEYLAERYDTDRAISFAPGSNEAYEAKKYLYFQASGQGPYFGQAVWFKKFHPETVPSAQERYIKEAQRLTSVLEGILSDKKAAAAAAAAGGAEGENGPWLVGDKFSIADLVFIPWTRAFVTIFENEYKLDEYPVVKDWYERMLARPGVAAGLATSNHA